MTIFIDSGPIVALLSPRDTHNSWAAKKFDSTFEPFQTCEAVLCEAFHLLKNEPRGIIQLKNLLRRSVVEVHTAYEDSKDEVLDYMDTYDDLPMDFADACLLRQYERVNDAHIFTLDGDFNIYRDAAGNAIRVVAPWQST